MGVRSAGPTTCSRQPMGSAGGGGGGARRQKPTGRGLARRCWRACRPLGRTRQNTGRFSVWTSRARGDAAGAVSARWEPRRRGAALHRVSGACTAASSHGRVRPPSRSLAFPSQPCMTITHWVPLGTSASRAFTGCRELGGRPRGRGLALGPQSVGRDALRGGREHRALRARSQTWVALRRFRPGVRGGGNE